ncbi:MAG: hypothetical protein KGJ78_11200 [Alphaproteobacteria bacterium]|nr:hypothetical protein [Alphaproteobacteria bacterium]
MRESASIREPAIAAAEAVKAYIRMNRVRLAADGELLALLLPERFEDTQVADLLRFAIERLKADNQALRLERDALKSHQASTLCLGEGVRRAVLELIDARSFEEAIGVATGAAAAFGADRAVFCVEDIEGLAPTGYDGVRLIPPGMVAAVVGPEGMGAILSGGGELLFGRTGYRSLAAFRLRVGREAPPALYVLGARDEGCFDGRDSEAELGYFARALERAIRAWLDLPKP